MDIYSKGEYPANALSNFAEHTFLVDDILCHSMEGFLQSLKFKKPEKQRQVCLLIGKDAKKAGKGKLLWRLSRSVWWCGKRIRRQSEEYQELLDRAFCELFKNEGFRQALKDSGRASLTHSEGCSDPRKTVLTVSEFIGRLERLRELL